MKPNIHLPYHHNTLVKCACGNTFTTGSILPEITVEICGHCHPFYTGVKKLVDTEGRVEKFERIRAKAQKIKIAKKAKEEKAKAADKERKAAVGPKTLREMLTGTK